MVASNGELLVGESRSLIRGLGQRGQGRAAEEERVLMRKVSSRCPGAPRTLGEACRLQS